MLSGMSSLDQVRDNVSYMEKFKPLSQEERAVIEKARKVLGEIPNIPCTACEYCIKGCPQNIRWISNMRMIAAPSIFTK